MIEESVRIKIVRALLHMNRKQFAAKLHVKPMSVTFWETGRCTPKRSTRARLSEVCDEAGIMFLPSGFPIPKEELLPDVLPPSPKIESEDFSECLDRAQESPSS